MRKLITNIKRNWHVSYNRSARNSSDQILKAMKDLVAYKSDTSLSVKNNNVLITIYPKTMQSIGDVMQIMAKHDIGIAHITYIYRFNSPSDIERFMLVLRYA